MKLRKVDLAMVEKLDEFYSIPYRAWLENGMQVHGVISVKDIYDLWRILDILLTDVQHQVTRTTLRARLEDGINEILQKGNINVLDDTNIQEV